MWSGYGAQIYYSNHFPLVILKQCIMRFIQWGRWKL
uniref:Uncharacterized protein n=1 Tax=Arundo donax TaxID=35708 RepID=A0A0A9BPH7_ARUDO